MDNPVSFMLEMAIYTTCWIIVSELCYRLVPIPDSIKKIEDKKERKVKFAFYASYYPALIHAPLTTLMSILCVFIYGLEFNRPIRTLEWIPGKFSTSFFLMDLLVGIYRGYNDKLFSAHHLFCVVCVGYGLVKGMYGSEIVQGLAQGEITNPLIAMFDVLTILGYPESTVRPLGIAFMATFIAIRTTITPYSMFKLQATSADLAFKIMHSSIWVISMLLIWMMLNKIAKLLSQSFPNSKPIGNFYKIMVKLRPYAMVYNVIIVAIASIGIFKYYLGGNAKSLDKITFRN